MFVFLLASVLRLNRSNDQNANTHRHNPCCFGFSSETHSLSRSQHFLARSYLFSKNFKTRNRMESATEPLEIFVHRLSFLLCFTCWTMCVAIFLKLVISQTPYFLSTTKGDLPEINYTSVESVSLVLWGKKTQKVGRCFQIGTDSYCLRGTGVGTGCCCASPLSQIS